MQTFISKHEKKRKKITKNVIKVFKQKFPFEGDPVEYETIWPLSKWCYLQTYTKDFLVELDYKTGKVIDIVEDF